MMVLYPEFYYKNVQSIDLNVLKNSNIKGMILDVDNTLIDYEKKMPDGIKEWVKEAKKEGFKLCIVSNSSKLEKVSLVAKQLHLEYFFCAKKPAKRGFQKALELLSLKPEECVAIGDQVFTDVIGANMMHIHSLYVEPINRKEFWYTAWKRPFEWIVLKCFFRGRNGR